MALLWSCKCMQFSKNFTSCTDCKMFYIGWPSWGFTDQSKIFQLCWAITSKLVGLTHSQGAKKNNRSWPITQENHYIIRKNLLSEYLLVVPMFAGWPMFAVQTSKQNHSFFTHVGDVLKNLKLPGNCKRTSLLKVLVFPNYKNMVKIIWLCIVFTYC